MVAPRVHPKKLLVEGKQEQRTIPYLIEANGIPWGPTNSPLVYIDEFDGITNLLQPGVIEAELKATGLKELGIVVDANSDAQSRYSAIRSHCVSTFLR